VIRGAVLGGDVSRSRSPGIHAAAFRALGREGRYDVHSIDAAGFAALVARLGDEGYDYLNITIPHKRAAAALADGASALVRSMAAANTLIFRRGRGGTRVRAENTDGYGLLAALGDLGVRVRRGDLFVMAGSGGAAAGALAALIGAGARVRLVARRPAAARALRRRFPAGARARISVFRWEAGGLGRALDGARALISAVPAAAWADPASAAGLDRLRPDTAVLEMAYGDATALGTHCRARGLRYQDGLPMLVHQAARAVELVTGRLPPAAPLLRAARTARPGASARVPRRAAARGRPRA
jgi:shikimate dehydrogenase